jgi:hypothetical protein
MSQFVDLSLLLHKNVVREQPDELSEMHEGTSPWMRAAFQQIDIFVMQESQIVFSTWRMKQSNCSSAYVSVQS